MFTNTFKLLEHSCLVHSYSQSILMIHRGCKPTNIYVAVHLQLVMMP